MFVGQVEPAAHRDVATARAVDQREAEQPGGLAASDDPQVHQQELARGRDRLGAVEVRPARTPVTSTSAYLSATGLPTSAVRTNGSEASWLTGTASVITRPTAIATMHHGGQPPPASSRAHVHVEAAARGDLVGVQPGLRVERERVLLLVLVARRRRR